MKFNHYQSANCQSLIPHISQYSSDSSSLTWDTVWRDAVAACSWLEYKKLHVTVLTVLIVVIFSQQIILWPIQSQQMGVLWVPDIDAVWQQLYRSSRRWSALRAAKLLRRSPVSYSLLTRTASLQMYVDDEDRIHPLNGLLMLTSMGHSFISICKTRQFCLHLVSQLHFYELTSFAISNLLLPMLGLFVYNVYVQSVAIVNFFW